MSSPGWVAPLPLAGRIPRAATLKTAVVFLVCASRADQPRKLGIPFTFASGQGYLLWSPDRGFDCTMAGSIFSHFYSEPFYPGVLFFSNQHLKQHGLMAFSVQAAYLFNIVHFQMYTRDLWKYHDPLKKNFPLKQNLKKKPQTQTLNEINVTEMHGLLRDIQLIHLQGKKPKQSREVSKCWATTRQNKC